MKTHLLVLTVIGLASCANKFETSSGYEASEIIICGGECDIPKYSIDDLNKEKALAWLTDLDDYEMNECDELAAFLLRDDEAVDEEPECLLETFLIDESLLDEVDDGISKKPKYSNDALLIDDSLLDEVDGINDHEYRKDSTDSNDWVDVGGLFCRRVGNRHVCDCDYHTYVPHLPPPMTMGKDEL